MNIRVDDDTINCDCTFIKKALTSTAGISNFEEFRKRFDFPVFAFNHKTDGDLTK
ncbi:MAG: hypothetical protein RLZZ59_637 [Pseudomonadota bacterium]